MPDFYTGSTGVGALRADRAFFGMEESSTTFFGALHIIAAQLGVISDVDEMVAA